MLQILAMIHEKRRFLFVISSVFRTHETNHEKRLLPTQSLCLCQTHGPNHVRYPWQELCVFLLQNLSRTLL